MSANCMTLLPSRGGFSDLLSWIRANLSDLLATCSIMIKWCYMVVKGFPDGSAVKNPPAMEETWIWSLGWEDPLEKEMATHSSILFFFLFFFLIFIFTLFYFTILYWFRHTLTWICHGCTWVPNPEPPSHLPPHDISLGHPRAPAPSMLYPASDIDCWLVSYMIVYMFQCYFPKSSQPLPLPQSPKVRSTHLCLFCCFAYRVIIAIFLNSIYMF